MNWFKLYFVLFFLFLNQILAQQYQPNWQSLDSRPLPLWYDEAKFGIFTHWGVYSVPAFGSEWFWQHWKGSNVTPPSIQHFMDTHYKPNTTYADFGPSFTAIDFNATQFAEIIKSSGAKYFVLTTKHHEGFTLWPSDVSWNWNAVDLGPNRDLVGEIRDAILKVGGGDIHWGTYFSLLEWFNPIYLNDKKYNTSNYVDMVSYPQLIDLVTNYKPDIVWSDGDWDFSYTYWKSQEFLAWLYNESPVKDTVVTNDRWGVGTMCAHGGYYTCADNYEPGVLQPHKWENCDSLDQYSWGFRRNSVLDQILSLKDFISELVLTISTGGNLLMNIGPDHNGRVLPIFEERLRDIGAFVNAHSEAIFATKPWIYQNDSDSAVWYTSKLRSTTGFDPYRLYNPQQQNNTIIYAFVLDWPENNLVNLPHILPTAQTKVTLFGANGQNISLNYNQPLALNGGIQVDISSISLRRFPSTDAFVLRIEYAANQCPPNFVQSNSNKQNCLSLIDNKLDWTSANKDCAAKAATLISIGNSFENSEIQGLVKNCSQAYIGLNRTNNNWNWVDGDKSAYTNWKTGYPTTDSNSNCAAINQNDGKWINQDCNISSCYICKLTM